MGDQAAGVTQRPDIRPDNELVAEAKDCVARLNLLANQLSRRGLSMVVEVHEYRAVGGVVETASVGATFWKQV